jgi:hypothetical protein
MMDTTLLISAQTIECNIAGVFNQFNQSSQSVPDAFCGAHCRTKFIFDHSFGP